jgi:hypothetical protein
MTSKSMLPIYLQIREQYLTKLKTELYKSYSDSVLILYLREAFYFNCHILVDYPNKITLTWDSGKQFNPEYSKMTTFCVDLFNSLYNMNLTSNDIFQSNTENAPYQQVILLDTPSKELESFLIYIKLRDTVKTLISICELIEPDNIRQEFKNNAISYLIEYETYGHEPDNNIDNLINELVDKFETTRWCGKIIRLLS